MIEVFKITKHKYDYKVASELIYNINKVTGANDFRLSKSRSHYDLRKYFRLLIELLIFGTACLIVKLMLTLLIHSSRD